MDSGGGALIFQISSDRGMGDPFRAAFTDTAHLLRAKLLGNRKMNKGWARSPGVPPLVGETSAAGGWVEGTGAVVGEN